ncbi:MAG: ImmA/IrrE family metallo-endopeptidase [bacterium]|nr:ImmA/IrrE family metallo-endopeptidase [bacterium]
MDACSWLTRNHSWVLLETGKTAVRERFDLAHELGHLILHPWLEPNKILNRETNRRIEEEAHRFAEAFLMPADSFAKEVLVPSLSQLQVLKSRWKVSIQAMIRRLFQLDIIDEHTYKNMNVQLSVKGWKRFEPLDDQIQKEEPSTLRDSIELLIENQIKTPEAILLDLKLPQDEVETLCSLPAGRLNPQKLGLQIRRLK